MKKPKGFEAFDKLARALVQVPKSELSTKDQVDGDVVDNSHPTNRETNWITFIPRFFCGVPSNLGDDWDWRLARTHEGGMCINLISPAGLTAATVFLRYDVSGHNWFIWDEQGGGGENSKHGNVEWAMYEAEQALVRSGWHNCCERLAVKPRTR